MKSRTQHERPDDPIPAGAVIGGGVEIGRDAWVRAGAVVLSSVPANAIVEGNPPRSARRNILKGKPAASGQSS